MIVSFFKITELVLLCFIVIALYYLLAQKISFFYWSCWQPTGIRNTYL